MRMHTSVFPVGGLGLAVLLAALGLSLPLPRAVAQMPEPKNALPDAPDVPEEAAASSAAALTRAWESDARPRVRVVVSRGAARPSAAPDAAAGSLEATIEAELVRQLGAGLGSPQATDDRTLLELRAGTLLNLTDEKQAREAARSLVRRLGTDLLLLVSLGEPDARGAASGSFTLTDLRYNEILTKGPLVGYATKGQGALPPVTVARRYAAHIVDTLARDYPARAGKARRLTITLSGLERQEELDDVLLVFTREFKPASGRPAEAKGGFTRGRDGLSLAEIEVWSLPTEQSAVRVAMSRAVRQEIKRRMMVVEDQPGNVQAMIVPTPPADWARLTAAADMPEQATERAKRLALGRAPTIVVLVGAGVDDAIPALDRGAAPARPFDDERLAGELGNWLRNAGMDVQDPAALARKVAEARGASERFKDFEGFIDALDRAPKTDFVLLASVRSAAAAGAAPGYNIRLLDRRQGRARQAAFVAWPDQRYTLFDSPVVRAGDASSVAQYVVGNILSELDRWLASAGNSRTVRVTIANVEQLSELSSIAAELGKLKGVTVAGLAFDRPLGSLDLIGVPAADAADAGKPGGFMDQLVTALKATKLSLIVERAADGGGELAISLLPRAVPPAAAESTPRPDAAPGTPPASGPAPVSGILQLDDHLRRARGSVWLLGVRKGEGTFLPSGTGWTVQKTTLATNAHVALDMLSKVEELPEAQRSSAVFAALRHDGKEWLPLTLDTPRIHPGYIGFIQGTRARSIEINVPPFDVAIVAVKQGDPGPALKLAGRGTLNALSPGDALGYVGYPVEGSAVDPAAPLLGQYTGRLVAMGDALLRPAAVRRAMLLQVDLMILGGASGSPVINASGEVIALVSSRDSLGKVEIHREAVRDGKVIKDAQQRPVMVSTGQFKRVMLGAGYAQRVDLLQEMLEPSGPRFDDRRLDELLNDPKPGPWGRPG